MPMPIITWSFVIVNKSRLIADKMRSKVKLEYSDMTYFSINIQIMMKLTLMRASSNSKSTALFRHFSQTL